MLHVLPHPGGGGQRYIDLLSQMGGYRFEQIALTDDRSPVQALRNARRLRRLAPSWDLVHVHGEASAILCAGLFRSRPGVFHFHGLHLSRRSHGPRLAAVRWSIRRATRLSRGAICSSASEREEAAALVGSSLESRLVTIESAVEIPPPIDPGRRLRTRRELGLRDDQLAVILAVQLEPRKAPFVFLEGLSHARRRRPELRGLVLGEGPLREEVAARAPAAGADFLGERPDFERLLEASDIFVLPSEREGMSLAVLGAMAAGLPVVVSDGPGNPDAVGEAGEVFPVGDVGALAAALERLAADPGLRARLGEAARERAIPRFSAERMARETRGLYDRAMASGG